MLGIRTREGADEKRREEGRRGENMGGVALDHAFIFRFWLVLMEGEGRGGIGGFIERRRRGPGLERYGRCGGSVVRDLRLWFGCRYYVLFYGTY